MTTMYHDARNDARNDALDGEDGNEDALETITRKNQSNSPFLRLPAELRTLIYEQAFLGGVIVVPARQISFLGISERASPHTQAHQGASALLHTCRQIRHEALANFYLHTMFDFRQLNDYRVTDTLEILDPYLRAHIRSMKVNEDVAIVMGYSYESMGTAAQVTPALRYVKLPSLIEVHVNWDRGYTPRLKRNVLKGFQEAARKTFGRRDLIAHNTTTEMPDKGQKSDGAGLLGVN